MKFSIVLLVLVSGKFSCNSTCAGEGITRKSQFFLTTQYQGFTPHELASLRRENFFLTYFKHYTAGLCHTCDTAEGV